MARVFNGSNQYLANLSFASGAFPITLSAWIYTGSASHLGRVIVWLNASGDVIASLTLNLSGSTPSVWSQVYKASTGLNSFASVNGVVANTWHHVAAVVTATGHTAYLDGVAGTTVTFSTPTMTGFTRIHLGNYPSVQYFNGRIAYPAAYSADLAGGEVADLGAKLNGAPCGVHPMRIRPESLVACWPLGGFDGDHDGDIWANAYNLTAYNSPTWDEGPAVLYSAGPLWLPAFTLASSDRTATIAGTMGAMSASLSAGFTKPTFAASITGTQAPMTAALSASRTLPTDTASVAASHAPMSASLATTVATVQFSASIATTNSPMSASVSATFDQPTYTASIAATLGPMTAALSATFAKPVDTASVAATLAPMTSMVSATSATEIDTASIIATLCAMTASLTAAFSDVIYVTTECGIVPHFTRSTVPRFRRRNIVASIRRNTVPKFRRARR